VVFLWPPLAHVLGKDSKGVFQVSFYDDCLADGGMLFGLLHGEICFF
jgi:hypothetical protein